MRVAVLSFDDPWAASHGGTQRTLLFLEAIRAAGHEPVCVFAGATDDPRSAERRDASNFEYVAAAGQPAGETRGRGRLGAVKRHFLPLPTIRGGQIASLRAALAGAGPFDVLLTQQLRGVPYLEVVPEARLWLDQTDLWSRFLEVEIESLGRAQRLTAGAQRQGFLRAERRAAQQATVVTAAGHGDAQLLQRASGRRVQWLPTAVLQLPDRVEREGAQQIPTAGLLANFSYWPNVDAYELLAEKWLQPLRSAGWSIVVAGYGSEKLREVDGIELHGPVETPLEFYAAIDVSLAPIRLGAGIKVKVLESLFAGRPVLATPAALEGFPAGEVPGALTLDPVAPRIPSPAELPSADGLLSAAVRTRFTREGFAATVAEAIQALS